jgi:membrane protein YdbS with pleckstrin-like domain
MRTQVDRNGSVQGVPEPFGGIIAFLIIILVMLFLGYLVSLIDPSYIWWYHVAAMLTAMAMILYLILFFMKYRKYR